MAYNPSSKRCRSKPLHLRFEDEKAQYSEIELIREEPLKTGEKIKTALALYSKWGEALRADPSISRQLRELAVKTKSSSLASLESGVARQCRQCDENEGGSCCGAGIENRYTPEMLLINLIMGIELPESRYSENSCYFLGSRGCILAARELLCINYLCSRLQKEIPHENLILLQETTGREMDAVFILHDTTRNFIKKKTA
jgi:hypothetical protein